MDHGIETGGARGAAGKPAVATIRLRARREGEHVVVEVEDDGGGIDAAEIRKVAAERGLVIADALSGMSEADVVDLIFVPGFSTATRHNRLVRARRRHGCGTSGGRAPRRTCQVETASAQAARCASSCPSA